MFWSHKFSSGLRATESILVSHQPQPIIEALENETVSRDMVMIMMMINLSIFSFLTVIDMVFA
jgi:hypothetical protein